jgi:hypothetical protein
VHALAAVQWGTIPGWATFVVLTAGIAGAALWAPFRAGTGPAIESLEANVRALEEQRRHDQAQLAAQSRTIAELQGRTDVTLAIAPLMEWSGHHEERAQARHEAALAQFGEQHVAILTVLDLIAARLGPDPNGNGGH